MRIHQLLRERSRLEDIGEVLINDSKHATRASLVAYFASLDLGCEDHHLPFESLFTLGWIGDSECTMVLDRLTNSSDPRIRAAAGFVLAQIDEPDFCTKLINMLTDESVFVRRIVSGAISWHGGEYHLPALISRLSLAERQSGTDVTELRQVIQQLTEQ